MLRFVNNTAPSGGAIVFHKQSHIIMDNLEKKSEVTLFNNLFNFNLVATAIFIMDENSFRVDLRCFHY